MRIDAQQNRDRVLAAARAEFTAHGAAASLNKIAQSAGVGPGTLYRHFPSLPDLLVAVIADDVAALCAHGESLQNHPRPGEALRDWLRAVAVHSTAMRGLVAAELLSAAQSPALSECHNAIRTTGSKLLRRAEESRSEQSRSEQSRSEQGRSEQSRSEQSPSEQSPSEESRSGKGRVSWSGESRSGMSRAEESRAEERRAEESRAEESRQPRPQPIDIDDLFTAINALAWAAEQGPRDPGRLDRLLAMLTCALP